MPSGLATRTTNMAVSVRSQKKLDTFTAGLKSFINEARMLAQFDSPALVKVHSFWEGNGTAYMVMPYYEGITLKQALQTQRIKPTEGWIRMLLADLCEAIDILHRSHCLHRDIAPDNILLLKDGRPLLLDFGAARRVIGDLTQCFTAILKPGFAPIEQYADIAGLRQGAWTDIYALAAVVYYLITGKAPPPSVARMVHDELVPAREAGKGRYSETFLATIDKALSVRPEQRFHSIDELRHALNIMEPEPRTVPYPGGEWTTTVARTVPIAPPANESMPATSRVAEAAAVHNYPFDDLTRHAASPVNAADDVTGIAPPAAPLQPAEPTPQPHPAATPTDRTAYAGSPLEQQQIRQSALNDKKAPASFAQPPRHAHQPTSRSHSGLDARIEPELLSETQMAGDWHNADNPPTPPHRHEGDAALPRRRDKQGWLVLAILFAAGIGSGIYLGTNHSWDGLSGQAIESEPQPSVRAPAQSSDQPLAAVPPSSSSSGGAASSGGADSSSAASGPGTQGSPDESQASLDRLRSEIESWKSASKANQVSGYEAYLRDYPQGLYAPIAKLRLERLQAAAAPKPARPEAQKATPSENKVAEASKPEAAATPTSKMKPEEEAWTKATSVNTAAAYQEYLHKYPKGGYSALARDRLTSMKSAANRHLAVPSQPEVPLAATTAPAATATRNNPATAPREPQQQAQTGAKQPGSASTAGASSGAGPASSSASGSSAPSASTATPSIATPSTQTVPTQAATTPTAPKDDTDSQDRVAALTPSSQPNNSDAVRSIPPPPPPQSSKSRDSDSSADNGASSSGRTIQFGDQTMVGDFTVDKKTGLVSGKGKIAWSNGNQFEGNLVQGSKEGRGKFTWNSGQRYSGDWSHDAPNGKGVFVYPDGSRYEGEVKDGLPHGQGTTRFKNGIVYNGNWARGKINGQGRYTWSDGSYWEGEFRDDKRTENGKMYYPSKNASGSESGTPASNGNNETQRAAATNAKGSEEK
jgi:serine/threonine protein kinase